MEVKWYSGYKGEERPLAIIVDDNELLVKKVISRELIEDEITGQREYVFVVETAKGIYKVTRKG